MTNFRDDSLLSGPGLRLQNNFINVAPGSPQRQIIDNLNTIDGLTVEFEPQKVDVFLGQPIDGLPGWLASSWYLDYNIDYWPWIFHDEHGWQYVASSSTSDVIFLWDLGLEQWVFLNEDSYRWLYLYGPNEGWIYALGDNASGRRFFQRLDNGSLFSVPPDLLVN